MKYYIQYVTDGTVNLRSFHSEKARNTFERDFHRKHQFQKEYYVDVIFEGNVTFVSDGFKVDVDEFDNHEKHIEAHLEVLSEVPVRELRVGDRVKVLEDEECVLKAGELGRVVRIYPDLRILIQSENPSCDEGRWYTNLSNLELINE